VTVATIAADVRLRPVEEADREFLCAVYASTREEELAPLDWTPQVKQAFLRMQFDAQDAHYREHYQGASLDVLLVEGKPAGRLYVARWPDRHEIRLMDIALLPEFRGRGTGEDLLRQLMREAGTAGCRLTIHVERLNPALRLYERLGFTLAEDKGVYLFMEWRPRTHALPEEGSDA
jgi:ribosomal protein S18 acetylase RimI-like enzyme